MDIFAGEAASFDGWTLYEGDIVLDMRTRLLIRGGHLRRKRAVKKLQSSRWPNGEIPYVVDRDLGKAKTLLEFTITKPLPTKLFTPALRLSSREPKSSL